MSVVSQGDGHWCPLASCRRNMEVRRLHTSNGSRCARFRSRYVIGSAKRVLRNPMLPILGSRNDSVHRPLAVSDEAWPVKVHGVEGLLSVNLHTGDVSYTPSGAPPRGMCLGAQWRQLQLSGWQVVGAALDSPSSLRVWYCSEVHPGTDATAPRYQLRKSPPFAAASSADAHALVQQVRRGACWWGREAAPRAVVVVNPASGQGRAATMFQKQVVPLLQDAAGFTLTQLVTERPGHATALAAGLDPTTTDLVLVVGGDGTVWEVLQGLLSRPDWQAAAAIPVAHIPGGSGNGLAHSCGLHDPLTAAYAAVKGVTSALDVASVLQPPGRRLYLALSLTYGLLSNLDVGTEHLRWMGDLRFTLGGLRELIKGGSYHASVAWLPGPDAADIAAGRRSATPRRFTPPPTYGDNQQHASVQQTAAPAGAVANGATDPGTVQQASDPGAGTSAVQGSKAAAASSQLDPAISCETQDFPPGPPLPHLSQWPRLPYSVPQDPAQLPPGWRCWHEPLASFAVVNPPWIAATARMNPLGALNTGHMDMLGCAAGVGLAGRLQALALQLAVETGDHMGSPLLLHDTVRAMVFEPRDHRTVTEVDGEVVAATPLYLEVHRGLLTVLINPAHPEEPAAADSRAASRASMGGGRGGGWFSWLGSCMGASPPRRSMSSGGGGSCSSSGPGQYAPP